MITTASAWRKRAQELEAENGRLKAWREEHLAAPCVCQWQDKAERVLEIVASVKRERRRK